jgi:hypothetical protein
MFETEADELGVGTMPRKRQCLERSRIRTWYMRVGNYQPRTRETHKFVRRSAHSGSNPDIFTAPRSTELKNTCAMRGAAVPRWRAARLWMVHGVPLRHKG